MTMPDAALFLGFMAAALALNLTPGPDMTYVATRTLAEGRAAGIASALGIGAGSLVHTILATIGLSSLLAYAPYAFDIVKYAGAAYLVWIAFRLWHSGGAARASAEAGRIGAYRAFSDGLVTNVLNPKVALFFLALLPQFIDSARGSAGLQMLMLGLAFTVSGTIVNAGVALLVARVRGGVSAEGRYARIMRRLAAILFVGFAVRLALADRP
jgi:threonine/homoserine/homoserine lactone efflux protein